MHWNVVFNQKTPKDSRYFLVGLDERQLFIAQTSGPVTTVDQAHRSLGNVVQVHNARRKGSAADRQGEWFFLQTDTETRRTINEAVKKNRIGVQRKVALPGGGNPHTADQMVIMKADAKENLEHGFPVREQRRFVRGCIRHIDHKTIRFSHWREVVSNNEGATQSAGGSSGVYFID